MGKFQDLSENNKFNYSAEPAAKGTTTVMNMNHNTQAGKQNPGVMRKVTHLPQTMGHQIHTHKHTQVSAFFLLAILKTKDAKFSLSFSIAIITPKIEKKSPCTHFKQVAKNVGGLFFNK